MTQCQRSRGADHRGRHRQRARVLRLHHLRAVRGTDRPHVLSVAHTPFENLMLSLLTFAVGFVGRPIGAIVIGRFGDRAGRKPAMLLSFTLMGIGILGIVLTPSYAMIGPAAPVLAGVLQARSRVRARRRSGPDHRIPDRGRATAQARLDRRVAERQPGGRVAHGRHGRTSCSPTCSHPNNSNRSAGALRSASAPSCCRLACSCADVCLRRCTTSKSRVISIRPRAECSVTRDRF